MKIAGSFILLCSVIFAGCAQNQKPSLTPLEIQSLQTREYEHPKDIVFASVMSVFQDIGYTIKSASKDTGLITAESAAESDSASKFWLGISSVSQTNATAFVEEVAGVTRVRLSFVTTNKKSYGYGQTDRQDVPILDAKAYQNAFERISNAIFVRSEK
jgi:hypothetical protein